jgi:predicted protein tyrosine phosphatase
MIEVHPRLFIGTELDYESQVRLQGGWWVVHACKEPYHRQLLGYASRAAPKTHPEYLFARREKKLFLNLVDVDDPNYIPKEIMDEALAFIDDGMRSGDRLLVHCNQGESRSPSIGLLYLAARANSISSASLPEAEADFRRIYPHYNPKAGMRGFLLRYWSDYIHSPGAGL